MAEESGVTYDEPCRPVAAEGRAGSRAAGLVATSFEIGSCPKAWIDDGDKSVVSASTVGGGSARTWRRARQKRNTRKPTSDAEMEEKINDEGDGGGGMAKGPGKSYRKVKEPKPFALGKKGAEAAFKSWAFVFTGHMDHLRPGLEKFLEWAQKRETVITDDEVANYKSAEERDFDLLRFGAADNTDSGITDVQITNVTDTYGMLVRHAFQK